MNKSKKFFISMFVLFLRISGKSYEYWKELVSGLQK